MSEDIYKTPEAELTSEHSLDNDNFYVVSKNKFVTLYLGTLGLYGFYWMYTNWRRYKEHSKDNIWPIPRAIFHIFFTHSLFRNIDQCLLDKKITHPWKAETTATFYVVLLLVSNGLDRASAKSIGSPITDILSIAVLPLMMWVLLGAQHAINTSQNDLEGKGNCKFTIVNCLWLIFGGILWVMVVLGLLMELGHVTL
ncbi:hypothetical protein SAMN02745866_00935 [Alteromonadaceae bacterium Bs31]|nr:hypothetical protein SAMN02745866_00935 [Alteromonadaceae bacterium Bs31]